MKDTPWSDGTPGLSQNHIQPGCEFLYKWKATQHGSYWYHSHTDLQIDDGLLGPIIIHPKSSTPNPYSLVSKDPATIDAIKSAEKHRYPMLLSDWRHIPSSQAWDISEKSHIDLLCFDSILVNGKGKVDCLASAQQTPLITRPQKTLLDRVNGSTLTDKRYGKSQSSSYRSKELTPVTAACLPMSLPLLLSRETPHPTPASSRASCSMGARLPMLRWMSSRLSRARSAIMTSGSCWI